ncbi:MAG: hypothetical protein QM669_00275 [Siphonobacter sp.]
MNKLKRTLSIIIYQLYANALLACVLLALGGYLLAASVTDSMAFKVIAAVIGFGVGLQTSKLYQNKRVQAIKLMHDRIGETEYSLGLLDKDEYTIAERLQLERLSQLTGHFKTPQIWFSHLGPYLAVFAVSLFIFIGYPYFKASSGTTPDVELQAATQKANPLLPPVFKRAQVTIESPAYTGIPLKHSSELHVKAYIGSILTWRVSLSATDHVSVVLVNSKGEELPFQSKGSVFEYRDKLLATGLYAIKAYWSGQSERKKVIYQSDYYQLEAQLDLAPQITPDTRELYTFHVKKDPMTIQISAKISDDFQVKQAYLMATLARGSGENVKFREVKIPLQPSSFKEAHLQKVLDLKALNFTPGDELYYYWAALDSKQPEANFTKSDTYFIVYKDSTQLEEADLATMAVNIMPEYFRSQRQIIIDTEKLIAKRRKITESEFKYLSNEIGFDQKALRLRYGQFLGEEFENSIGGHDLQPEGNILEGYVHKHDTENEGAKAFAFKLGQQAEGSQHEITRPGEGGHHHGGGATTEAPSQDPLAALMEQYVHNHDDGEVNTFHEESTKSLLKMSVEQMWQSELHLRMYEPEKALPIEKKALEYLKMAQHKARSFVKKSSSDPPPIKEKEKRLTGELKNVNAAFSQERFYTSQSIRKQASLVLGLLEQSVLTADHKRMVIQLSAALTESRNWSLLKHLQQWGSTGKLSTPDRQQLKAELYEISDSAGQTSHSYTSKKNLERSFWQHLQ